MPAWTLPTGPGNVTRYPILGSAMIIPLLPAGVTEGPPAEVAHHGRVHGRDDARQGELPATQDGGQEEAHDGGQHGDQRRVPQHRDQVIHRIVIDLLDSAHMCIPVLCRPSCSALRCSISFCTSSEGGSSTSTKD